jgi:GGDEF domain-containing protein
MQTLLAKTLAMASFDALPRRMWEPALPHLATAVVDGKTADLLESIEAEARAVALDGALSLSDIHVALGTGATALRQTLTESGDPAAAEACRRLLAIEREALVRAGIGYAAGLEEMVNRLTLERERRSPHESVSGAMKPRHFLQRLQEEVTRCQRMDLSLGVAALALENAREASCAPLPPSRLRAVGGVLRRNLRGYDAVGRSPGGDFLLALPDVSRGGLMSVAERLRRELADEARGLPHARHLFALAHFGYVDVSAGEMIALLERGVDQVRCGDDYITWS